MFAPLHLVESFALGQDHVTDRPQNAARHARTAVPIFERPRQASRASHALGTARTPAAPAAKPVDFVIAFAVAADSRTQASRSPEAVHRRTVFTGVAAEATDTIYMFHHAFTIVLALRLVQSTVGPRIEFSVICTMEFAASPCIHYLTIRPLLSCGFS